MARTKTRTDEEVLDTALSLIGDIGVGNLTFAALATRSGLSSATLVQRFTNKATLIQRALLQGWDKLDATTRSLAASTPLTPRGAVELLVGLSGQYADAEAYANGLLILREDLRDPLLRRRGTAWEAELTAALDARLSTAPGTPTGAGHALATYWQGSLTWWAFQADTPLEEYLTDRLSQFLALVNRP
ncbi:TetR family transcriptional regulator [Actinoalloteichus caeruleus]|uniref:TetR family transcriptional regulator n=1 Tax=Actinoalloteichus cyanogriseus TaxID=2893586 RepID=UPI003AAECAFE